MDLPTVKKALASTQSLKEYKNEDFVPIDKAMNEIMKSQAYRMLVGVRKAERNRLSKEESIRSQDRCDKEDKRNWKSKLNKISKAISTCSIHHEIGLISIR